METCRESSEIPIAVEPSLKAARLAVGTAFFAAGVLVASWVSRIPAVQAARNMSHGALGLALLGIALGALVAMPAAGWCAARFGSDRVTRVAAALTCVGLPLLIAVPNGLSFAVALFGFGVAFGGLDVAMNTQAVAVERRYGRPINSSFHALFSLGGLVGAAAGGVVAAAGVDPLHHFIAGAALMGGVTALVAFPRLLDGADAPAEASAPTGEAPRKFVRPPRALLMLGVVALCVMMGEGAIGDWSAVFLRKVSGASEGVAAAGYAAFSVAMAIGRFAGDGLASRLGPVALVRASGAVAAAGLGIALALGEPWAALIGFVAVGLGFSTVIPQIFTAAGRTPGLPAAAALSVTTTIGYFGFLIGPPLIGFAAEAIGLRGALGIVVVMSLVVSGLAHCVRAGAR